MKKDLIAIAVCLGSLWLGCFSRQIWSTGKKAPASVTIPAATKKPPVTAFQWQAEDLLWSPSILPSGIRNAADGGTTGLKA